MANMDRQTKRIQVQSTINRRKMVVALDIGTSFSAYAYSSKVKFNENPLAIWTNESWEGPRRGTMKTPSTLLVNQDKEFHSFGYAAQIKYGELCQTKEQHGWGYFRNFKMKLHDNDTLNLKTNIESEDGFLMTFVDAMAMAIKFLKNHLIRKLTQQDTPPDGDDIVWVITVPAIWSDKAKSMMRESASRAGITDCQLMMSLEPEAGAIYCHMDFSQQQEETGSHKESFNKTGSKFILCDLGGGTADICGFEVTSANSKSLKQIIEPTGWNWGGMSVDTAFMTFLEKLVSQEVIERAAEKYPQTLFDIYDRFESSKRSMPQDDPLTIDFEVPNQITAAFEEANGINCFNVRMNATKYGKEGNLKANLGTIKLQMPIIESLFSYSTDSLVDHLKTRLALKVMKNTRAIVLVGGFSSSPVIRKKIINAFPAMKVIFPRQPELSVVKGAVMFGHNSNMISQRIVRHTYGVNYSPDFAEERHDKEHRYVDHDGKVLCSNAFHKVVERGSSIDPDSSQCCLFSPNSKQTYMDFHVFRSSSHDPLYVTEPACTKIATIRVPMPDTTLGVKRTVVLTFKFGETEISVSGNVEGSNDELIYKNISLMENVLV